MNLSPEVAAVLRQALREAEYARCHGDYHDSFNILAGTIENLLEPVDDCYCGLPESSHRLGCMEHSYRRRPQHGDPAPIVSDYDGLDLPF